MEIFTEEEAIGLFKRWVERMGGVSRAADSQGKTHPHVSRIVHDRVKVLPPWALKVLKLRPIAAYVSTEEDE